MTETDGNGGRHKRKSVRPATVVATIGLVISTLIAIGALGYDVVVNQGNTAPLVSIAGIGVGALASLAGASALHHLQSGSSTDDES